MSLAERQTRSMPRKPDPPPSVDVVYDTSAEAEQRYLDAIKFLIAHIRDKRARQSLPRQLAG
jgi:hypothetical protein